LADAVLDVPEEDLLADLTGGQEIKRDLTGDKEVRRDLWEPQSPSHTEILTVSIPDLLVSCENQDRLLTSWSPV
jgi:hypothetical protein